MSRQDLANMMTRIEVDVLIEAAVLAAQAEEREACAKVCEDLIENFAEHTCAAAIRARGPNVTPG